MDESSQVHADQPEMGSRLGVVTVRQQVVTLGDACIVCSSLQSSFWLGHFTSSTVSQPVGEL